MDISRVTEKTRQNVHVLVPNTQLNSTAARLKKPISFIIYLFKIYTAHVQVKFCIRPQTSQVKEKVTHLLWPPVLCPQARQSSFQSWEKGGFQTHAVEHSKSKLVSLFKCFFFFKQTKVQLVSQSTGLLTSACMSYIVPRWSQMTFDDTCLPMFWLNLSRMQIMWKWRLTPVTDNQSMP